MHNKSNTVPGVVLSKLMVFGYEKYSSTLNSAYSGRREFKGFHKTLLLAETDEL